MEETFRLKGNVTQGRPESDVIFIDEMNQNSSDKSSLASLNLVVGCPAKESQERHDCESMKLNYGNEEIINQIQRSYSDSLKKVHSKAENKTTCDEREGFIVQRSRRNRKQIL